ncbi:hypothetical protein [uncultured Hyphomicrobium sp.]|uniref:hypothetical protein n=1 Tax=uncultured Hyphomicrobium sp. TaxID=194373 RepID=UPI0025DE3B81|nr:hypothetical protein [uncultured Hyphomicrobium sp.]
MIKKMMSALMALMLVAGVTAASIQPAEAGRGGRTAAGIAAGIIGLGLLGAYAHSRDRDDYYYESRERCYPGPEECGWKNRRCFTNSWGDTVCRGGRWTCWRPTYCD